MKIIVGYLLSPQGDAALEAGIEEARRRDAELIVMHSSRGGDAERGADVAAYRVAGERIEERLKTEGVRYRLGEHVVGNTAAQDIVGLADTEGADLIVIGVRRRSTLGKMVLGSTAHDVIMNAPCPVLAVKAPGPAPGEREVS